MNASPAASFGAAAALPGREQRRPPFLYADLQRASHDFDHLLLEVSNGIADQRHYDGLETRAQIIAEQIVAAFRGPKGVRS